MAYTDLAYAVFQGKLYGAKRAMNGPQTGGFVWLGDVEQFAIDPKLKFEDVVENFSGYGFTVGHTQVETALNVKMRLIQLSQANWELALWATASGAVDAGSVSGETITIYPGAMAPLAHPGVSNVSLSAGVEDVDYTVDAANGAIQAIVGSTVFDEAAGVEVTVSYDFAAYTGSVEAFTTAQPIMQLRLHGFNTMNDKQPTIVHCYQWAPDMTQLLDLISKKRAAFELNGMLLQDQSKPLPTAAAPYSQFLKVVRA
jgi:hypothetical protein